MVRAWDLDGVLCDFDTAFIALVKEHTGIVLPPVSNSYPDVWAYHRAAGVTEEQNNQMWQAIMEGDFWATLDPLPGAREVLAGLARQRDAGDDIYFLTARPGRYAKQFTEWWLEGQGYDCPTVLISRDKGSVCQGLKVEFFIDDKPENCREVKAYCPRTEVFLLDRPHNRSFVVTPFATRVQSILDPRLLEIPQDVA